MQSTVLVTPGKENNCMMTIKQDKIRQVIFDYVYTGNDGEE